MAADEEAGAGAGAGASGPPKPPKPPRKRHDGFTPGKQRKFLKALKKSGCLSDAARVAGISTNTVRRHRDKWPAFDAKVEGALAMASVELDMVGWKRPVEGAEEKVIRDGKLAWTKIKPSDSILRLLMQGANPKKYGRTGQMPKGAMLKKLRRRAEKEAAATLRADEKAVDDAILKKLGALRRRRLAEGHSEGPGGMLVPPGYRVVPEQEP